MANSYHISPDGKARACSAPTPETCPFKASKHYASLAEANFAASDPRMAHNQLPGNADWHNPRNVLFSTPHGSHLYGLAHAGSDEDFWVVYPPSHSRIRHSVVNGLDATRMSFGQFVERASVGSPQALEAMFSTVATVDSFAAFRRAYRATGQQVVETYMRTIRNFSMGDNYKRRRHAMRLALNLNDLLRYARFDPRLSEAQARRISTQTNEGLVPDERYIAHLRDLAPFDFRYEFEVEGQSLTKHIADLHAKRVEKANKTAVADTN